MLYFLTIFPFVFDTCPIKTKVRDPLQGLAESLMIYNNLQPQSWCLSPDFLLVLTTLGSLSSTWRTLEQPPLSHINDWDSAVLILTIHCPRPAIAANCTKEVDKNNLTMFRSALQSLKIV